MASFTIDISSEAEEDLQYYRAYERKTILTTALASLRDTPAVETNERKRLRPNPIAPWEVKVGKYRILYAIEAEERRVTIIAIGHKVHNILYIRGKVVSL